MLFRRGGLSVGSKQGDVTLYLENLGLMARRFPFPNLWLVGHGIAALVAGVAPPRGMNACDFGLWSFSSALQSTRGRPENLSALHPVLFSMSVTGVGVEKGSPNYRADWTSERVMLGSAPKR